MHPSDDPSNAPHEPIIVPYERLSEAALHGVVEEYITREGTDYGHSEATLDDKRQAVLRQLRAGLAHIEYDPESETCTLRRSR